MNMKKKLTAIAAALGLATAGTASAFSLGEVWVGDQQDGKIYIFDQSELNDPSFDAVEETIDLTTFGGVESTRMHLIGFSNHSGLDPNSRGMLAYLVGAMDIVKTNGGTHAPTLVTKLDVSNAATGAAKNSLHMCGGNPQNTLIGCSSIGNKELVLFSMDIEGGDNYTRIGGFPLSGLAINSSVKGKAKKAINAAIDGGILNGAPICNNFNTTSDLMYVTTNNGGVGGVLVLDITNPANPTIRDAFNTTGVGCGLVNTQHGEAMWTNTGSKSTSDDEKAHMWNFADAYDNRKSGPAATVDLPEIGGGDVHGAQLAGLGGHFLWELMRLDDKIYVIEPLTAKLVNTIDIETAEVLNPAGDVLDRSALGTRMYASLRGAIPTTAITGINDPTRTPGVMVIGTVFGYDGVQLKTEDILSGNTQAFCPSDTDETDPNHDHDDFEQCDNTHPHWEERIEADTADPHGLKSLNYTTGGF